MFTPKLLLAIVFLGSTSGHPMFRSLEKRGVAKVFHHCAEPNTAALTFDDGPFNWMDQIVDTLDAHGAKGTFFLNGRNWDCIYNQPEVDRVKRAFEKGHQIASHTWSHAHLNSLSKDQVSSEFSRTITAIEKITGSAPSCTRPPYGEFNDAVEEVAVEQSQNLILWDFDSGDSSGASDAQAEGAYDSLAGRHPDTILALNHEIRQSTATTILPHAIEVLQKAGYKLVTVADCLNIEPYIRKGSAGQRDGSWTC